MSEPVSISPQRLAALVDGPTPDGLADADLAMLTELRDLRDGCAALPDVAPPVPFRIDATAAASGSVGSSTASRPPTRGFWTWSRLAAAGAAALFVLAISADATVIALTPPPTISLPVPAAKSNLAAERAADQPGQSAVPAPIAAGQPQAPAAAPRTAPAEPRPPNLPTTRILALVAGMALVVTLLLAIGLRTPKTPPPA